MFDRVVSNRISTARRESRALPFVALAAAFLASRLLYVAAGVRFDEDLLRSSWALLDTQLLRTDLIRSIVYLHSQPPLFNLLVGLVLKAASSHAIVTFRILNICVGMLLSFSLYEVMYRLHVPARLGFILVLGFAVSPATILFENIVFYTYPLALALVLSALLLERFVRTQRLAYAWLFFALTGSIVLTRSLFHPVWYIAAASGLIYLQRQSRRQLLVAASFPLLLIAAWTVKNEILFGTGSGSSWMGMSLAKMVTVGVPASERARLVEEHILSPYALRAPFGSVVDDYGDLLPRGDSTGVPALDLEMRSTGNRNFNQIAYVEISRNYMRDALLLVARHPEIYFRGVVHALFIFFRPSSDYSLFRLNRPSVEPVERVVNMALLGQIHYAVAIPETNEEAIDPTVQIQRIGILLTVAYVVVILAGLVAAWKCARSRSTPDPPCVVTAFLVYTILYVTLVGNALEIGENNRFRFMVDPVFLILLATTAVRVYRSRRRQEPAQGTPSNNRA